MLLAGLAVLAILALIPVAYADHSEIVIEPVQGSGIAGCQDLDGCFIPLIAVVQYGGTIVFTNTDNVAHTFTAGTPDEGPYGTFDSGLVIVGSSFEWQADRIGEIPHFCIVHPWATGLIIVEDSDHPIPETPEVDSEELKQVLNHLTILITNLQTQIEALEERIAVIETALEIGDDAVPEPEPQTGIQGKAYTDTNNNDRYDAGEPLLSGVPVLSINLSDHSDTVRDQTDSNGEYFIERDAGSYLVQVEFTNSFAYLDVRTGSVTTQNLGVP